MSDWLRAYIKLEERYGKTRGCLDKLHEAFAPIPCLEANISGEPSDRYEGQPPDGVVELLLREVRPRLLFVYGNEAIQYISDLSGCRFTLDSPQPCEILGQQTSVYPRYHLTYQLSHDRCTQLGQELRDYLVDSA